MIGVKESEYDKSCRNLYAFIINRGLTCFDYDGALYKWRSGELLLKMIKHFEAIEEYERCCFLKVFHAELLMKAKDL